MKQLKHIFVLTALITFLLTGCKDACEEVTCENGGTCVEGTCECPDGFSGTNCETNDKLHSLSPSDDDQTTVQEALITMADGDILEFSAGTYYFTSDLSVEGKSNITIRGVDQNTVILDFSGQTTGAQGLYIDNCSQVLLHDFTIQDAAGDNIKAKDCTGISFINISAVYNGEVSEDNGAYALYPVTSSHVLVDNCYIRGASDAGIYVGQSDMVIVSNNTVEENVAGIEVENCTNSDVFGNYCTKNTGGILVFDLQNLPVIPSGSHTRVFDNIIVDNSHLNFAPAGNIVGNVPPGTGIMLLAANQVEIFDNTITNNNTLGIGIVNYEVLAFLDPDEEITDENYDPASYGLYIHDNVFSRGDAYPPALIQNVVGTVLALSIAAEDMPDIVYDCIPFVVNNDADRICVMDNSNAVFGNIDAENNFSNINYDETDYLCTHDPLPTIVVDAPRIP